MHRGISVPWLAPNSSASSRRPTRPDEWSFVSSSCKWVPKEAESGSSCPSLGVAPFFHRGCCVDRSASCVHFTAVFAVARDIESRMVRRTAHSILSPPHGRLKIIERFFIVNCARNGGRRADLDPGSLL